MDLTPNYNIKKQDDKPMFACKIEWVDTDGKVNSVLSTDPDEAETILGLLTGNITLEDLKS